MLASLLQNLDQDKSFLTTELPDALDWTSKALEKIKDVVDSAADILRNIDKTKITGEQAAALEAQRSTLVEYGQFFRSHFSQRVSATAAIPDQTPAFAESAMTCQLSIMAAKVLDAIIANLDKTKS